MAAVMMDSVRPMPIGFRFHPTDEEYLRHYLQRKNSGDNDFCLIIPEIDFCKWEPRELPGKFRESSEIPSYDPEWWFFCEQGQRAQRSTNEGFWKITGHDRKVMARSVTKQWIGTKKTLVFHEGKGRKAKRTSWVMHEYHLPTTDRSHQSTRKFTPCRVKCKDHDEHDSNTSTESQRNNHPIFDDSIPDDHLIPEDAVQAKMAWFMSSCLDPMLDHHVQTSVPCPLEPIDVSHHLKSSGLDYQNKEQTGDDTDLVNENPLAQSDQAKKPCSLEPDSPHSGLHKRSSVYSLPDFIEDVYQKNEQAEDVKDFLNHEPESQFGQPLVEVSNTSKDQAIDVDSKKDKGIIKDYYNSVTRISCLAADSPPTQQREYVPIKQETSYCSSYLPKADPELTVLKKKSRKIQTNTGTSNEPEPPNKIPRNQRQTVSSTAATLQIEVDSWHGNEGGGIVENRI